MISLMFLAVFLEWPMVTQTMKPWAYNWWMGSAVDEPGLEYQCAEMEKKGFGGFHVIPIYGAEGSEGQYREKWRPLLSPDWIEAWNMAAGKARKHNLGIDLTMGSGWCFGGPWVDEANAASSLAKVKRAGLGGEGYMIDPFSAAAMSNHVAQFEAAFGKGGTAARPRAFYHDSYEYFGARPKHGGDGNWLQLNCFKVWTDWCRENGYLTRNEAHGAPSNWLDLYALADIPETEMFGRRNHNRDILLSKIASSAAHVKGTVLSSAETCTWVEEHFCERPLDIKIVVDQLFLSGVNHIFYHGLCYSPVDAGWPGWTFYASLEMNPRNPLWREIGVLNAYVARCQSIFQTWALDNDLALIFDPVIDGNEMTVHNGDKWFYAQPIGKTAKELWSKGYQFDYITPSMLKRYGTLKYREVIDPKHCSKPVKAKASPFGGIDGLMSTRWRRGDEVMYFVVNHTGKTKIVDADSKVSVMDPMSGDIYEANKITLYDAHSLFVTGDNLRVLDASMEEKSDEGEELRGWEVSPIAGGPIMPETRHIDKIEPWSNWDENFAGTMVYRTSFDGVKVSKISLGDVREIARVRINGVDIGCKIIAPYIYSIPSGVLKGKGNKLEIEVTSLGSNRIRWNDRNGVNWKYFTNINMVDYNYSKFDASKWATFTSGIIGPVSCK